MLYEFALTPDVLEPSAVINDDKAKLILVELLKGMCDNGILPDLNEGDWFGAIRGRVDNLPPNAKDQVIRCFSTLANRHRIVKHQRWTRTPAGDDGWLNVALES